MLNDCQNYCHETKTCNKVTITGNKLFENVSEFKSVVITTTEMMFTIKFGEN
jgi:hypothetical protein